MARYVRTQSSFGLIPGSMLPGYEDREIAVRPHDRLSLPDDVFSYPLVETWRDRVWRMLEDFVAEDVKAEFVRHPPEYVVSDDLSWLDELIYRVTGKSTDIKTLTADRMRSEYRAFRAGHATRTNDLSQFYRLGLKPLSAAEIEDRARAIFLNGQLEGATEERLQRAIEELDARGSAGGREGRLYCCAREDDLFSCAGRAGHYLIYGSEYLFCLGIRMISRAETKRVLSAIGSPTLFVCDIPMSLIRPCTLDEFAGLILEFLFCELVEELEAHALSPGAGAALSLTEALPAECIIGHYHPATIFDPFRLD